MAVRVVIAVIMLLVGAVWVGQGIGRIGGSFMTGQAFWAVMGAIVILLAVAMLQGVRRDRRK